MSSCVSYFCHDVLQFVLSPPLLVLLRCGCNRPGNIMYGGRGALYGWLSHVHYVLERKKLRYPLTPSLGRLLVTTSIVRPRWSPEVWSNIHKLDVLWRLTFTDFLLNRVCPSLAVPGACAANPIELIAAEADSDRRNSNANSSSDYPVAKNRNIR